MALLKTLLDDRTGVGASYWRIGPVFTLDASAGKVFGRLDGYLSQEARAEGKQPLGLRMIPIETSVQMGTHDQRARMYAAAKLLPEFDGSTDV